MNYREFPPARELTSLVRYVWVIENGTASDIGIDRILPGGSMNAVFYAGAPCVIESSSENMLLTPSAFALGQLTESILVKPTGTFSVVGVRFLPQGIAPLLHVPVAEVVARKVDLSLLWGNTNELEERLALAASMQEKVRMVENFLLNQLRRERNSKAVSDLARMQTAVEEIIVSGGELSVGDLAETVNLSKRQLERRFEECIGITPKTMIRIIRLKRAALLLESPHLESLTDAALECGYFDQAHFIKDFQSIARINPHAFRRERHTLSRFFMA